MPAMRRGLERDTVDRLLAHAHPLSTSSVFKNLATVSAAEASPLHEYLVKMSHKNAIVTAWFLLTGDPVKSGFLFCQTH